MKHVKPRDKIFLLYVGRWRGQTKGGRGKGKNIEG
jgi:hypothetical protein